MLSVMLEMIVLQPTTDFFASVYHCNSPLVSRFLYCKGRNLQRHLLCIIVRSTDISEAHFLLQGCSVIGI